MTVEQTLTINLDDSLARVADEIDALFAEPQQITFDARQARTQGQTFARNFTAGLGGAFDARDIEVGVQDAAVDQLLSKLDDTPNIETEITLEGEERLEAANRLVEEIDAADPQVDIEVVGAAELNDVEDTAERIESADPTVTVDVAGGEELAQVEDSAERLEQLDPTVNIDVAGGEGLDEIGDQAERIDRLDPTVNVDVRGGEELGDVADDAERIDRLDPTVSIDVTGDDRLSDAFREAENIGQVDPTVNIDITGDDRLGDAFRTAENVGQVEPTVNIDINGDNDLSDAVRDAERLDEIDPTVRIDLTDDELAELRRNVEALDGANPTVRIGVQGAEQIGDATTNVDRLEASDPTVRVNVLGAGDIDDARSDVLLLEASNPTVRIGVDGDDEIREVLRIADDLRNRIANIDVLSDASELQEVVRLARQIDDFTASIDLEVQDADLRQALDFSEELDAVRRVFVEADISGVREAIDVSEALEEDRSFRIDVLGEDEIRTIVGLADSLRDLVARVTVETDPSELEGILDLARQIDGFRAFIDIEAQTDEVRDALNIIEDVENVNAVINFQARTASLENAQSLAEQLDRDRTTRVNVVGDLDEALRQAQDLNDANITPQLEIGGVDRARAVLESLGDDLDFSAAGDQLLEQISGALGVGAGGAAALGGIAAIGVGAGVLFYQGFQSGLEQEQGRIDLQLQTGLSGDELAITGAAGAEAYIDGFGETLGESRRIAAEVEAALADVDPALDLELSLRQLEVLRRQGIDTATAISVAQRGVNQELFQNTEEAFASLIVSSQLAGSAAEGVVDALSEFGPFFSRIGIDGPTAIGLITEAWNEGLLPNLDRGPELIEEFIVEITTGAPEARRLIEDLGLNFEELQRQIADGEGEQALASVSQALLDTGDSAFIAERGVAVFRTAFEGAANPEDVLQILAGADAIRDVNAASQESIDLIGNSATARAQAFSREFEIAIADVNDGLVAAFGGDSAELEQAAEELGTLAGEAIIIGITEVLPAAATAISGSLIPALVDGLVPEFEVAGFQLGDVYSESIAGAVTGNPIGGFLNEVRDQLTGTTEDVVEFGQQTEELRFDRLAEGADEAGEGLDGVAESAETAEDALARTREEVERITGLLSGSFDFDADGIFRDVVEQTNAWAEGLADLSEVSVDAAGNIDITTEAGFDLQEQLEDSNQIVQDLVTGFAEGDVTGGELAARLDELSGGFAAAGEAAGLSADETQALIERYLEVPDEVLTEIIATDDTAQAAFDAAIARGESWDDAVFQAIAVVDDRASAEIDRIARQRTVTLSVRASQSTNRIFGGDGLILDSSGIQRMGDGGELSGIATAVPGGQLMSFNGRQVIVAENGGDELFLNSRSSAARQLDLIEQFDGGRLAQRVEQQYGGDSIVHNWAVQSPIPDPAFAAEHLASQISGIVQRATRQSKRQRRWAAR